MVIVPPHLLRGSTSLTSIRIFYCSCSIIPGTVSPKMQSVHTLVAVIRLPPANFVEICSVFMRSKSNVNVGMGQFQTISEDVSVRNVLMHSAH